MLIFFVIPLHNYSSFLSTKLWLKKKTRERGFDVLFFCFSFRDKLAPVKLNRYKDDLLFYMFYTNAGDVLQLAAANEL